MTPPINDYRIHKLLDGWYAVARMNSEGELEYRTPHGFNVGELEENEVSGTCLLIGSVFFSPLSKFKNLNEAKVFIDRHYNMEYDKFLESYSDIVFYKPVAING